MAPVDGSPSWELDTREAEAEKSCVSCLTALISRAAGGERVAGEKAGMVDPVAENRILRRGGAAAAAAGGPAASAIGLQAGGTAARGG